MAAKVNPVGGANVIFVYIKWKRRLTAGAIDLETMMMLDEFFKAIRQDLGLSNRGLDRGILLHMILKDSNLFFAEHKRNPEMSLSALALLEQAAPNSDASIADAKK